MKFEAVGLMIMATVPMLVRVAGDVKEFQRKNEVKGKGRTCWWNCPPGRECEVQSDGSERCVCVSRCKSRHKPVCGTDGQLYVNHCELHRTACVSNVKIKIDWNKTCLWKNVYKDCPMEKLTEMRSSILTTFQKELDKQVTSQTLIDELYFRYNRDGDHSISASEIKNLVTDYVIYPNIKELAKACEPMQWFEAEDKDENGFLSKEEFSWSFASKPEVKIQMQRAQPILGTNLTLHCQVQGYPVPVTSWLKDQKPLNVGDRVVIYADGDLVINGLKEEDTGVYTCEATNDKGMDQKYAAVEVQKPVTEGPVTGLSSLKKTAIPGGNEFFVFGSDGVDVIDPETLSVVRRIRGDDVISGMTSPICTEGRQRKCNWGGAVNVNSKYIYVADFLGRRVLILDVATRAFVQEVQTADYPYQIKYFRLLDEVWVLCWGNSTLDVLTEDEDDNGTLAVIGEASKSVVHTSIKAQIGDGYTKPVHGFFEAENCALKGVEVKYGYVTHIMDPGLHEVDLVTREYSRFLNLSGQCHGTLGLSLSLPQNYAFVQCYTNEELDLKAQVVVDTKNNQIVSINTVYFGFPFASPDGQFVITLNYYAIFTQYIDPVGNIHRFPEIKSTLLLSSLAFYPCDAGYDVYVTSKDQAAIIVLHVDPNGIETRRFISSVGKPSLERDWVHTERPIVIGCEPNVNYLATPATADDEVIILDGQQQEMRGRVKGIKGARTIVWAPREPIQ